MSSQVKAIKAYYFIINRVVNDFRLSTFKVDSRKVGEYFEVENSYNNRDFLHIIYWTLNKKYLFIWSVCFMTSFKKTKTNNGYTNLSIKAFLKNAF